MDRLQEIKDRLAAATPGPWRWGGYLNSQGPVYLSTVYHGRVMVMTFERLGMQGAAPVFWQRSAEEVRTGWGGRPESIRESAVCEVEYRNDIDHIDNPDAQLIEHAPADEAWLIEEIERLRGEVQRLEDESAGHTRDECEADAIWAECDKLTAEVRPWVHRDGEGRIYLNSPLLRDDQTEAIREGCLAEPVKEAV